MFVPVCRTIFGLGYKAEAHTVLDLEADPTGNCIYAEGEVIINHLSRKPGTVTQEIIKLNNRGFRNVNGYRSYVLPLYTVEQAQDCLNHLLGQLRQVGRQG